MMQQTEQAFEEKRREHRRRVLKSGALNFNSGYSSLGCRVRNLTEHGALLEMESTVGVPSEFDFLLSGETSPVSARIVWREANRMGIQLQ